MKIGIEGPFLLSELMESLDEHYRAKPDLPGSRRNSNQPACQRPYLSRA